MILRIKLLAIWLLCLLAAAISSIWMVLAIIVDSPRARKLAIAHDQLFNATTGGDEDETISSRAEKARRQGRKWGCVLCRLLDAIQPGHCAASVEADRGDKLL